jgi:dihydrofolate reductase
MSKVRVSCFSISLDGFGAGPDQSVNKPLGVGGEQLHGWFVPTRTFQTSVLGQDRGTTGPDNDFAVRGLENVGCWILGRNMFGPVRGAWPNEEWKGWWGETPPYHCDVYVLSHHARKSFELGGTVFHFVTDGIQSALDKAKASAKGKDVRIGGGASTIRQYLQANLIDEMHVAVSPVLLGKGEPLFTGIDLVALGFQSTSFVATEKAAHHVLERKR